jgi:hypothetical protein
LTAPEQFSPLFFGLFKEILFHSSPIIRSAAIPSKMVAKGIAAIGYVCWPAFKSLLESLQQSDPDLNVRRDAEVMLTGFDLYVSNTAIAS